MRRLPLILLFVLVSAVATWAESGVLSLQPLGDELWMAGHDGVSRLRLSDGQARVWGREEGLPSRIAVDVERTPAGELWAATPDGPARLEGDRFVVHCDGLDLCETTCLLATPTGDLYVGTARGLAQWRGAVWEMVYETHEFGRHRVIDAAIAADGTLWFAKPRSLMRIAPNGNRSAWFNDPLREPVPGGLASTAVDAFHFDARGRFWIASDASLEVRLGEDRLSLELYRPGVWGKAGLLRPYVQTIETDAAEGVWLGFGEIEQEFVGHRADGAFGQWRRIAVEPPTAVNDLAHDAQGGLWAATAQGLYRLDAARQRFIPHAPTADRENSSAGVE